MKRKLREKWSGIILRASRAEFYVFSVYQSLLFFFKLWLTFKVILVFECTGQSFLIPNVNVKFRI